LGDVWRSARLSLELTDRLEARYGYVGASRTVVIADGFVEVDRDLHRGLPENQMSVKPTDDPILKRFKAVLDEVYGDKIARVVLFGSRARGEARPDSDYDVAVFLRELPDRWQELDRLADIGSEFLDDVGRLVHAMPFVASAWRDQTPLMHEIRKDGINI
jgi:uncharacterized protein